MLGLLARLEACLFARIERVIHFRFDQMELAMSAQTEAFKSALNDLSVRFSQKLGEMQGQIDAAKVAQAAQDDAAFKDATDQLTAMTASLGDHVDAMHQTATAAIGDATGTTPIPAPAAEAPLITGAPTPFQVEAENAEDVAATKPATKPSKAK